MTQQHNVRQPKIWKTNCWWPPHAMPFHHHHLYNNIWAKQILHHLIQTINLSEQPNHHPHLLTEKPFFFILLLRLFFLFTFFFLQNLNSLCAVQRNVAQQSQPVFIHKLSASTSQHPHLIFEYLIKPPHSVSHANQSQPAITSIFFVCFCPAKKKIERNFQEI